ncbi:23S rRNA (cytidine1920-2'-O)/16S rRNA (cytidine1409-2'-O)-methyltransferase [Caloramator fervidus]|uniref:23S rRNA (Cytidine1920-2'-O)/16S rRNA (Cytidine1409-2'-O)-methyltransferase n=1 Tax=Caloramator fervidus TaxID=29344 RepID=A0A1H5V5Q6_9CLOT|nr:TlyA family RNA methyltransferase [Caloramator fervidus]SEF82526.1 23S rRNA (cytidine1920-2'-O)/16S rRNA (cytidine1409-2'-O)-methyltransferase [Caloramator fervidus]
MEKERLDVLLVQKGFFETREKARKNIMAGLVFVNGVRIDKAGEKIDVNAHIEVKGNAIPYVSRGGLKLEKAILSFKIDLKDKIAIDVGASTGGFTDCMLKNGARKVYAIDVGYGQLAWELRNDPRVVVMERTNIRFVKRDDIGELADFSSIDVSFISLKLVLPVVKELLKEDGEIVALIKPQFEAGREKVGKKGVVKDPKVHEEVIKQIAHFSLEKGFTIKGLDFSPIKGPEGNIEYLIYLSKKQDEAKINDLDDLIVKTVEQAHKNLS